MKLTEHFTLSELTHSQAAARLKLDNTPTPEIVSALTNLAHGLEMVRALEKVEGRIAALEKAQPIQQQSADWMGKAVWAAVVVVAVFVAKKVGLM